MDLTHAMKGIVVPDISDACDALDIETVTTGDIKPVYADCPMICGPAVTYKLTPGATGSTVIGTLEGIVAAEPGSVLVFTVDGHYDLNAWGSIAATVAVQARMAGVVIDGPTRDVQTMEELDFPCYTRGTVVTSVRGRIGLESINEPIEINGGTVHPGWLVAADANGVIFFPGDRAEEIFARARRVASLEKRIMRQIAEGEDAIKVHEDMKYDVSIKEQIEGGA